METPTMSSRCPHPPPGPRGRRDPHGRALLHPHGRSGRAPTRLHRGEESSPSASRTSTSSRHPHKEYPSMRRLPRASTCSAVSTRAVLLARCLSPGKSFSACRPATSGLFPPATPCPRFLSPVDCCSRAPGAGTFLQDLLGGGRGPPSQRAIELRLVVGLPDLLLRLLRDCGPRADNTASSAACFPSTTPRSRPRASPSSRPRASPSSRPRASPSSRPRASPRAIPSASASRSALTITSFFFASSAAAIASSAFTVSTSARSGNGAASTASSMTASFARISHVSVGAGDHESPRRRFTSIAKMRRTPASRALAPSSRRAPAAPCSPPRTPAPRAAVPPSPGHARPGTRSRPGPCPPSSKCASACPPPRRTRPPRVPPAAPRSSSVVRSMRFIRQEAHVLHARPRSRAAVLRA